MLVREGITRLIGVSAPLVYACGTGSNPLVTSEPIAWAFYASRHFCPNESGPAAAVFSTFVGRVSSGPIRAFSATSSTRSTSSFTASGSPLTTNRVATTEVLRKPLLGPSASVPIAREEGTQALSGPIPVVNRRRRRSRRRNARRFIASSSGHSSFGVRVIALRFNPRKGVKNTNGFTTPILESGSRLWGSGVCKRGLTVAITLLTNLSCAVSQVSAEAPRFSETICGELRLMPAVSAASTGTLLATITDGGILAAVWGRKRAEASRGATVSVGRSVSKATTKRTSASLRLGSFGPFTTTTNGRATRR